MHDNSCVDTAFAGKQSATRMHEDAHPPPPRSSRSRKGTKDSHRMKKGSVSPKQVERRRVERRRSAIRNTVPGSVIPRALADRPRNWHQKQMQQNRLEQLTLRDNRKPPPWARKRSATGMPPSHGLLEAFIFIH